MDVVYFGSGAFGLPTLAWLARVHRLRAIVSQPPRPAGRGGRPAPTPVSQWAARHAPHVVLHLPEKVNDPGVVGQLRGLGADAWVTAAYGQKLGRRLLEGVRAVNLHASLLPRWRGAAPIHAAILAGDAHTGNTVFSLVDRMDAGPILAQSRTPIGPAETAGELHDRLADDGPAVMAAALERVAAGEEGRPQDERQATIAPKLTREDGWIDFGRPGPECARRVNGLSPWPGIGVRVAGLECKLLRAVAGPPTPGAEPGVLADAREGVVACGEGAGLRILELQRAGGKPMKWGDFARGARVADGAPVAGILPPC